MKALSEYCGIQVGVTHTPEAVILLEVDKKNMVGTMFIYPIWIEDYHDDRPAVTCEGYIWKMGKAEWHYRNRMKDKHAYRWIKRHRKWEKWKL